MWSTQAYQEELLQEPSSEPDDEFVRLSVVVAVIDERLLFGGADLTASFCEGVLCTSTLLPVRCLYGNLLALLAEAGRAFCGSLRARM